MTKNVKIAECSSCLETRPIAARGLCRTCYQRWSKNGSTAYVRAFKDRTCTIAGCDNVQHGQGLCSKHLLRLRRTGTTDDGRVYTHKERHPDEFISQHDLYSIWREFARPRNSRVVVPEWMKFENFVADVVSRPSKRHRIYPIDKKLHLGPGNFQWVIALVDKDPNETDAEYALRSRRARRDAYGTYYRDRELRNKYGIGLADYLKMAADQDYKCAMCREEEQELRDGIPRALAIDHCHRTKKVRSLLCQSCNKMLGYARDKPSLLQIGIDYLIKHGTNPAD